MSDKFIEEQSIELLKYLIDKRFFTANFQEGKDKINISLNFSIARDVVEEFEKSCSGPATASRPGSKPLSVSVPPLTGNRNTLMKSSSDIEIGASSDSDSPRIIIPISPKSQKDKQSSPSPKTYKPLLGPTFDEKGRLVSPGVNYINSPVKGLSPSSSTDSYVGSPQLSPRKK